jgi:hypothetical protein
VGKRHRRIRARSATGQVAGAATEKPGLQLAHRPKRPAQPAFSQKGPLSQSTEPKPAAGHHRALERAVSCPELQRPRQRGTHACFRPESERSVVNGPDARNRGQRPGAHADDAHQTAAHDAACLALRLPCRADPIGARAPVVSDVILRMTSQTTGRGDLCGAACIGLGDYFAATALASDARASREPGEPSRTLAPRRGCRTNHPQIRCVDL